MVSKDKVSKSAPKHNKKESSRTGGDVPEGVVSFEKKKREEKYERKGPKGSSGKPKSDKREGQS